MKHSTLNYGPAYLISLSVALDTPEKELLFVKGRRINILEDLLKVFLEPKVLGTDLKIEFINERAVDSDGVSREAYTTFWEEFLEECEGEEE